MPKGSKKDRPRNPVFNSGIGGQTGTLDLKLFMHVTRI